MRLKRHRIMCWFCGKWFDSASPDARTCCDRHRKALQRIGGVRLYSPDDVVNMAAASVTDSALSSVTTAAANVTYICDICQRKKSVDHPNEQCHKVLKFDTHPLSNIAFLHPVCVGSIVSNWKQKIENG